MTATIARKASLDQARLRIDRAREHISHLKREIAAALQGAESVGVITVTAGTTGHFEDTTKQARHPRIQPIASILVGEAAYNLRGALDYLVYELFLLNTGKESKATKFLIEKTEEGWNAHILPKKACGHCDAKGVRARVCTQLVVACHARG